MGSIFSVHDQVRRLSEAIRALVPIVRRMAPESSFAAVSARDVQAVSIYRRVGPTLVRKPSESAVECDLIENFHELVLAERTKTQRSSVAVLGKRQSAFVDVCEFLPLYEEQQTGFALAARPIVATGLVREDRDVDQGVRPARS